MKKLPTIVLALLLAPLVGTVALSDFNYIGQGGGGLSESDVQTLIDASVAAAAYAPAEDPNSNAFGGGGLVIGTNIVQMSFQTDPFGFSVAPQFVMQIPTPQTTPSIYFLCRGTVATVNAASGPLLFGGCTAGVEIADLGTINLTMTCADAGFFEASLFTMDGTGNYQGVDFFIDLNADDYAICGP